MTKKKFKDVKPENGNIEFIRASKLYDDKITGPVVEGIFVKSLPNRIDERKLDFEIEKEDGSTVIINGAGNLGYSMKFVDPGDYIRVNYHGKQEIEKGPQKGRQAHNFSVERAED